MSPLGIKILIHYYSRIDPYDGGENPQMVKELIDSFVGHQLLYPSGATYIPGPALDTYVRALLAVPLPVQSWSIPVVLTKD